MPSFLTSTGRSSIVDEASSGLHEISGAGSSHVLRVHPDEYVKTLIRVDGDGSAPRRDLFIGLVAALGLPPDLADTLLTDYRDSPHQRSAPS